MNSNTAPIFKTKYNNVEKKLYVLTNDLILNQISSLIYSYTV